MAERKEEPKVRMICGTCGSELVTRDAWAEWDTALWFEEGQPSPQVQALRWLLATETLTPPPDLLTATAAPLLGRGA